jgi:phage terminase large subunit GpA-like protein
LSRGASRKAARRPISEARAQAKLAIAVLLLGRRAWSWRFSDTLSAEWFTQLASERRVVRFTRGQPVARLDRVPGLRAEALDGVVYAMAARGLVGVAVDRRAEEVASVTTAPKKAAVVRSKWLAR